MNEIEITGGAGPFEAAAVAAVVGHLLETERIVARRRPPSHLPPAWVRAGRPRDPDDPLDMILPDHRGDPM